MDFGETYTPVAKLTRFWYLISLIGRYWWNMNCLEVVRTFLNIKIDDDNINIILWAGWPDGLNTTNIIVRLRNALSGLKQTLRLRHDEIDAFQLCPGFPQFSANSNLYLRTDGIMILLDVNNISMSYPVAATKAVIQVRVNHLDKYNITIHSLVYQFLGIEIHRDGARISLGQKSSFSTILRQCGRELSHRVSTPVDSNE